jgi:hypothetical protein
MKYGQGTHTYASGDKYAGEWKHNMMHGLGTYTAVDGSKYVGETKDNKPTRGKYYDKNGYMTEIGE